MVKHCILLLDNIRSSHNVGSLLRSADCFGVHEVIMCGITPYPALPNDPRPAHIVRSNSKEIHKTALGAEETVVFKHYDDTLETIRQLKTKGYNILCLENNTKIATRSIHATQTTDRFVLVLGSETTGIHSAVLEQADSVVEIPIYGHKHSLNVSVAGAIALYELLRRT